ncbi:DUF1634 domain-containing protein [Candidatus Frankia nodulisporulans]|uniref:DUF1634 domain-containing protein n=1 Tax=Candidatus Frankia nodulisporulans TaxID=2060052 RepID=UPI001CDC6A17|nr:DUF1634 domain-containing protein [Candidatus Frankia nodulisporulans]
MTRPTTPPLDPPDQPTASPGRATTSPRQTMDVPGRATNVPGPVVTERGREVGARPVAWVLRVGGLLGVLLVTAGLVTAFGQNGAAWTGRSHGDILGPGAALRLSDLAGGLRHARADAIVLLGMVVLAATPAAGVAAAGWCWLRGRQPQLAAVAALVLVLLLVAGALGAAE